MRGERIAVAAPKAPPPVGWIPPPVDGYPHRLDGYPHQQGDTQQCTHSDRGFTSRHAVGLEVGPWKKWEAHCAIPSSGPNFSQVACAMDLMPDTSIFG